ncbi:hypothetical protein C8R45DRAFT_1014876 [Mycena sanguinolenta]|nr:hypothetical protein C8R45DRAFT_1014876 [Mycena sanguinolenta]
MSSGSRVVISGALNLLQDLSNGSNIPALQPLVNVAMRIYTSAEGAKTNKRKAKQLSDEVCNSVNQISKVYPGVPNSMTADLHTEGVIAFQSALEDVAVFVEKIGKRGLFWRFVYQKEDGEELAEYRRKITAAQLQFLVTTELAKTQTRQREEQYPVFKLADAEPEQMLNPTNSSHTREIARFRVDQKRVLVRRYMDVSIFFKEIDRLMPLRHPNLPFLGASPLMAPVPFIVMELPFHSPAHEVIQGLYGQSRMVLQRTAIQIISGVLEGMHHLRENKFALSNLKNEISSIQYNGDKVILNVDLPKRKPLPKEQPTRASFSIPCETASEHWDPTDISDFLTSINHFDFSSFLESFDREAVVDIHEQENEVLQTLFGLRAGFAIPSALRPLWHHCIENDPKARLSDLRSVREELYKSGDRIQDISPALTATGNLPYLDFGTEHTVELGAVACVTKSAGMIIVCNVLDELRARKIVDTNPFTSTEIDEDAGPLREGPWEEFIRSGDGIFLDVVGDYVRYECWGDGYHGIEVKRTTTVSLHDPAARETRQSIQEYLYHRLPSLLEEHSWDCQLPTDGFMLVTSVRSRRTTELRHNHDTELEEHSDQCLHCKIWGNTPIRRTTNPETVGKATNYFHALPEAVVEQLIGTEGHLWGIWTSSIQEADGSKREYRLDPAQFSNSYYPHSGCTGAFVQLSSD